MCQIAADTNGPRERDGAEREEGGDGGMWELAEGGGKGGRRGRERIADSHTERVREWGCCHAAGA